MAIVISGSGIDMGGNPVSNASQIDGVVVNENCDNVATTSNLVGFKNYIINGKKVINQRGLTSTDNSYNQDRWYKSGNNWYQGIEGNNNLISGKTYTLSWEGEATASYYVGTETSATINAQMFTSISNGESFTLTISAGQNLWIKFSSDSTGSTFNFVQLEEGSVATPFEQRPYGLELSLCQRYYQKSFDYNVIPTNGIDAVSFADPFNAELVVCSHRSALPSNTEKRTINFRVAMRTLPTIYSYGNSNGHWKTIASNIDGYSTNLTLTAYSTNGIIVTNNVTTEIITLASGHWVADAEL